MGVSSAREKRGRRSSDERRSDSARSISRGYRSIRSRLDARPRVSQAISRAARTPFRRYSWRTGVRRDRGADYAVDQIRTRNFAAWSLCEARRSIAGHVNATLRSIEARARKNRIYENTDREKWPPPDTATFDYSFKKFCTRETVRGAAPMRLRWIIGIIVSMTVKNCRQFRVPWVAKLLYFMLPVNIFSSELRP